MPTFFYLKGVGHFKLPESGDDFYLKGLGHFSDASAAAGGNDSTVPLATVVVQGIAPSGVTTEHNNSNAPTATITIQGLAPTGENSEGDVGNVPLATIVIQGLAPTGVTTENVILVVEDWSSPVTYEQINLSVPGVVTGTGYMIWSREYIEAISALTDGAREDLWKQYLMGEGYWKGTLPDSVYEWMETELGYLGTISDKWAKLQAAQ